MLRKILLVAVPMALVAASANAANIVQNGGFTSGNLNDWTSHPCSAGCRGSWTVGALPADPGSMPPGTTLAAKTICVRLPCNSSVTGDWISQTLTTIPLESYTLTFFFDPGSNTKSDLDVLWNGTLLTGGRILNASTSTWEEYTFMGLSAPTSSTVLQFTGRDSSRPMFLTDIKVFAPTPVPEPASLLLIGGGLLGIGMLLHRRRA